MFCVEILSVGRLVSDGCICVSTAMASWTPVDGSSTEAEDNTSSFDVEDTVSEMINSLINNAKCKDEPSYLFAIKDILNVRRYYYAASISRKKDNRGAPPPK